MAAVPWAGGGEVGLPAPEHRRPPAGTGAIRRASFSPACAQRPCGARSWRVRCRRPRRTAGLARLRQPPHPNPQEAPRCSPSPATAASPATSSCAPPTPARRSPPSRSPATAATASADPVYVDLILWEAQAEAAAEHLVKGQAVAFTGRLEPRPYQTSSGEQRVALEVHDVDLEYGPKPRAADADEPDPAATRARERPADDEDIPF